MSDTSNETYRPRWWQVWLLPFAVPLGVGVVVLGVFGVWWGFRGSKGIDEAIQNAGQEISQSIDRTMNRAVLEAQRIQGVDTGSIVQLPVYWGARLVGRTTGRIRIGPQLTDTAAGATTRWVETEVLLTRRLGGRGSILGAVASGQPHDSTRAPSGLAALLARPDSSMIYTGVLGQPADSAAIRVLVAVLDTGDAEYRAIRLHRKTGPVGVSRGQLWLGPGPVVIPLH